MEYDIGGRRTKIATKGNASQQYEYDPLGNITGITDGAGNHTEYILDKWGRIVEIRQADGSSEVYGYDYAGNVTRTTDGEGNTTTYEYGSNNQLAVMTDPAGEQETYHYDTQERLCRITDRNGTETRYSYNIYDNLTERRARKTDGAELSDSYEYTPEGLLKSAISQGMRYSYVYDAVGRLTEKRASGRTLLSFRYDPNGNFTHQTDVTGKVTEYRYDLADNISEVWDNGKKIAEYEYNADDTVKKLSCGSLYTEYAYDADRNLTGLKTLFGAEVITDNKYTYDGNGNRLEKLQKHGTIRYSYDSMNRLNQVQYPGATEELFYDKSGNRIKRLYNGAEELYQYDRRNRLTTYTKGGVSTQYEYDNAGNLLKDDKARYEYDAFNRNTKVETFSGNIQINRYDAEDLRHEMEENGKLVSFIFCGDEVVAEENQEDRIRYIRTNALLASDAENARTYYHYASDEMSSITHVVDSEAGEILNRYEYDAWGNLTTCEEKVHNRFNFNGQQYDSVSQQYYLRARYYNPVIGRFTQEDTYNVDGLNLYAYCKNNPVYYIDPSGYFCKKMAEKIIELLRQGGICREDFSKLEAYLKEQQEFRLLETWEQEVVNEIKLMREVVAHANARAYEILKMQTKSAAGPFLSTVYDPKLGRYYYAQNYRSGSSTAYREYEQWRDNEADPIIRQRTQQYQKDIDEDKVELPPNHDTRLAADSEVRALDQALKARRALGMTVDESTISELYLYNIHLTCLYKGEGPKPDDRCENCVRITDGIRTIGHR